jgi:site-specific DNA-methyltransferase (adenine-specific)/modification methylase
MPPFENLHDNQIIHGNCLDILPQLPEHSLDLVITDPPFNIMNKSNIKFKDRTDIKQKAAFDRFDSYEAYLSFTKEWLERLAPKMKDNSSLYVFFAMQYITDLMRICLELNMKYKGILIWHKSNPAPKIRKTGYVSSTEAVLFMVKGKPTFHFLGQNEMHNLIETPICMGNERLKNKAKKNKTGNFATLHPTQKPIAIYEHFVKISSNPDDLICDPFAGTGTLNVACRQLRRNCVSIECNETYYRYAVRRLKKSKSKTPSKALDDWI